MSKIEEMVKKIEEVRTLMYSLMEERSDLVDSDVVYVSQQLDNLLNEYHDLLKKE